MRNLIFSFLCLLQFGCASVSNSEFELVSINGLSSEGANFFISPHGRTEIAGSNIIEGEGKLFLSRSRNNYNATVICPGGKEVMILVETGFDYIKGLYLPIFVTIATYGMGVVYALPSSLIDIYQNKAYSTDDIVLPVACTD